MNEWDVRQSTNWLRKGVKEEYFCPKLRCLVKKRGGVIYVIYQISGKIESKKRSSEMLGCKMDFFSKKTSFENFSPSQSRRQVSAIAPDLSFVPWHRVLYFNTCSRIISVSFYSLSLFLLFFFSRLAVPPDYSYFDYFSYIFFFILPFCFRTFVNCNCVSCQLWRGIFSFHQYTNILIFWHSNVGNRDVAWTDFVGGFNTRDCIEFRRMLQQFRTF